MKQKLMRFVSKSAMFTASFGLVFSSLAPMAAHAAQLTYAMDILTRVQESVAANHTIMFTTPTGLTAGQTFTLGFDTSTTNYAYTLNANLDYTDMDLSTLAATNCTATVDGTTFTDRTLGTSASGATWGVSVSTSTDTITFTSGTDTIAATACVRIEIGTNATNQSTGTRQITNAAAGSYLTTIGGTFSDSGTVAVDIISDDTIGASATVDPSIDFEVGMGATQTDLCTASSGIGVTTTLALGTITSSAINRDGYICTRLDTNATNGATVFMQSLTTSGVGGGQLTSSSFPGDDIPDAADSALAEETISAGAENYGACISSAGAGTGATSGGTPSIDAEFDGAGTCTLAAGTTIGEITDDQEAIWSVSAPTTNAFANLVVMTSVSGETEAHTDYTDYLVFTAAASF